MSGSSDEIAFSVSLSGNMFSCVSQISSIFMLCKHAMVDCELSTQILTHRFPSIVPPRMEWNVDYVLNMMLLHFKEQNANHSTLNIYYCLDLGLSWMYRIYIIYKTRLFNSRRHTKGINYVINLPVIVFYVHINRKKMVRHHNRTTILQK